MNWYNFILTKSDFLTRFKFNAICYKIPVETFLKKDKNYIILFESDRFKDDQEYFEILTKGDGSCFFYTTETIGCEEHKEKLIQALKCKLRNQLEYKKVINDPFLIAFKEFAENNKDIPYLNNLEESIVICESLISKEPLAVELKEFLLDYKYNICGFGIEKEYAYSLLNLFKIPAVIHGIPLPPISLKKIALETGIPSPLLREYDDVKETLCFNMEGKSINDIDVIHILSHRNHYSRLLPKSQFPQFKNWCESNNVEPMIIQIDLDN
jgi:hypothetical protein